MKFGGSITYGNHLFTAEAISGRGLNPRMRLPYAPELIFRVIFGVASVSRNVRFAGLSSNFPCKNVHFAKASIAAGLSTSLSTMVALPITPERSP
jgi:hypothetical protein